MDMKKWVLFGIAMSILGFMWFRAYQETKRPAMVTPCTNLIQQVLDRQQASAANRYEIRDRETRTGISCGALSSEEKCLAFLRMISTDLVTLEQIRKLKTIGVDVITTPSNTRISEDGKMLFLNQNATTDQIRQFLLQ